MTSIFTQVLFIGILAALSPGPDTFIVIKNSLSDGRKHGIFTALGVTSALVIHITYTILGFTILLNKWPVLYTIIQLLGSIYLLWLGFKSIQSRKNMENNQRFKKQEISNKSLMRGFKEGFLCNLLNPKAALFFLSIFSQFVGHNTAEWIRWALGGEVIFIIGVWFVVLSIVISINVFRSFYQKYTHWFDRILGAILIILALIIIVHVLL